MSTAVEYGSHHKQVNKMTNWIEVGDIEPPKNRLLIVHCPEFSDYGYDIAKWNGGNFVCETHDDGIDRYVERWALFMEGD